MRCSFHAVRFILWMKEKILWMILSEDSEDSDFDGFEPDDLLSY